MTYKVSFTSNLPSQQTAKLRVPRSPLEFEQFWFRCDGIDVRVTIVVTCEELGGPWNRDKVQTLVTLLVVFQ